MEANELKLILEQHELYRLSNGNEGKRANLVNATLSGANLSVANLVNATLSGANLSVANLYGANLYGANLSGANLSGANLSGANLRDANLERANLDGATLVNANLVNANLERANLDGATLVNANLVNANLSGANLERANLYGANLSGANLVNANLVNANLERAKDIPIDAASRLFVPPEKGAYIAFKKCNNGTIVELQIPETAKRSSATTRKCRASEALVLSIVSLEGIELEECSSLRDDSFVYRKGQKVAPSEPFNEDRWNECSSGIHHFMTRQEAVDWNG